MSNADKHIDSWSMTDVQRYLKGELSASEMHTLEKQALDDPFLADALEGLQTQPNTTREQDLAELHSRLDTRTTTTTRVVAFPHLRIAAAIIALLGIGFTAYYTLFHTKTQNKVATDVVQNRPATPPPAADSSAVAANQIPTADQNPAVSEDKKISERLVARPKPTVHIKLKPVQKPVAKANTGDVATVTAPVATYPTENPTLGAVRISKDTTQYLARSFGAKPGTGNLLAFSGRVLDQNSRPLAGASLTYNNKTTATITDNTGRFNLYLPQQDTNRQLTVAMIGYENAQISLNTEDRTGNIIYLKEDPARLDEVVVSGMGAKRKEVYAEQPSEEPEKLDTLWLNSAPDMGRIAYLNYLDTAKKSLPVDPTIHGTESISFVVDRKGALTDFKIERSLSPAHDAGVIHLIADGPSWKAVHRRNTRVLVNVKFP